MAQIACNVIGTPRSKPLQSRAQKLGAKLKRASRLLSLLLVGLLISGCVTTRTTATDRKSQCAAWRAITYSANGDTKMTVDQIRIHNRVGQLLKCWK